MNSVTFSDVASCEHGPLQLGAGVTVGEQYSTEDTVTKFYPSCELGL